MALYKMYIPLTGLELGNIKGKGCMVEMGHKDTGIQIATLGQSHDTSNKL